MARVVVLREAGRAARVWDVGRVSEAAGAAYVGLIAVAAASEQDAGGLRALGRGVGQAVCRPPAVPVKPLAGRLCPAAALAAGL